MHASITTATILVFLATWAAARPQGSPVIDTDGNTPSSISVPVQNDNVEILNTVAGAEQNQQGCFFGDCN